MRSRRRPVGHSRRDSPIRRPAQKTEHRRRDPDPSIRVATRPATMTATIATNHQPMHSPLLFQHVRRSIGNRKTDDFLFLATGCPVARRRIPHELSACLVGTGVFFLLSSFRRHFPLSFPPSISPRRSGGQKSKPPMGGQHQQPPQQPSPTPNHANKNTSQTAYSQPAGTRANDQ